MGLCFGIGSLAGFFGFVNSSRFEAVGVGKETILE